MFFEQYFNNEKYGIKTLSYSFNDDKKKPY